MVVAVLIVFLLSLMVVVMMLTKIPLIFFAPSNHVVLHIPKTGGSSIRATFAKCEGFQFPNHHTIARKDHCDTTTYYAVLRDPYERLFSSFTYYKYGSTRYNPKRHIATNLSFYQFLHGWSDTQSPDHALCTRITTMRDWKRTPWVWHVQFLVQKYKTDFELYDRRCRVLGSTR